MIFFLQLGTGLHFILTAHLFIYILTVFRIVIAMVYYGVTMHTGGNIGGNFYLNYFILGIVEIPAKLFVMATLNRAGRKKIHFLCMVIGGSACISTIFTVMYGGKGKTRFLLLLFYRYVFL